MRKMLLIMVFFFVGILWVNGGQVVFAQEKMGSTVEQQEGLKARCSTDSDCNRPGMIGVCQDPGAKTAKCFWQEIVKIPAIVIEPQDCRSCQTGVVVSQLRMFFPGLDVEYLKANDQKAKKLIDQMNIELLPAYIFTKDIERENSFSDFQKMVALVEGNYYLKPEFSGVSFFLNRKKEENKLDIFLVLTSPGMSPSFKIADEIRKKNKKDVSIDLHFLGLEDVQTKKIISPGTDREAAEEKVYACIEKYYPKQAWDYISDRLMNVSDIWIEDGLLAHKFDVKKIKGCAQGQEGEKLLRAKIRLSQYLNIRTAPLFLMNNTEIFGATEKTTADEVMKLMKANQ